jgi:hypothetical protein
MSVEERVHELLVVAGRDIEPSTPNAAEHVLGRVARKRRRKAVASAVTTAAVLAGTAGLVLTLQPRAGGNADSLIEKTQQARSLLSRPLHLPARSSDRTCPATPGTQVDTSLFGGVALGSGPVRILLADRGELLQGQVNLSKTEDALGTGHSSAWYGIQTLWFSRPGYDGPFVVRGGAVTGSGSMEVQPGDSGLAPGTGPLVVPAGPTANTSQEGYRTVPGSTWVTAPGCYAWQVDGNGFTEVIVFDAK